ncbi:MAG: coenzyme F420-dependent oxidoreductase [Natronomonas sp.]|jgi:coenzyme F420-dependent oxidoreductase
MTTVPFDLVLMTDDHGDIATIAEQAQRAEEHGFANVTMGETTGWNVVPVLAVIAERTEEIGITDDVLSPYARAPTVYGQTALTMDEITDGRFRLGLGTSSPALAERWHCGEFDRPLRRLRETIDIVREVYEGGAVVYDGEVYDLDGLSYDRGIPEQPPAIDVAALGPKGTELAGRFADGWVPQLFTAEGLDGRLDDLERGAELGERSTEDVRVSPLIRTFASDDPERARSIAKQMLSFLIGAYGPFYGNSVAEQGYGETVAEIRELWEERDTAAMAEALPDDLLDSVAAVGTPEDVRSKLETFAEIAGVDAIRLGFISGMSQADKEFTMDAVEPMVE